MDSPFAEQRPHLARIAAERLPRRDDIAARVTPAKAEAREPIHLRVILTPKSIELPPGTVLGMFVPFTWRKHLGCAFSQLQDEFAVGAPSLGHHCEVRPFAPDDSGVEIECELLPAGFSFLVHLAVRGAAVQPGQEIGFWLAHPTGSAVEPPKTAQFHPLPVAVRLPGEKSARLLAKTPGILIRPGCPARLAVNSRSILPADAEAELRVSVMDKWSNAIENFDQQLVVWPRGERDAAVTVKPKPASGPIRVKAQTGRGAFDYFHASDVCDNLAGRGHPIGRPEAFGGYDVLFGDIHCHCEPTGGFGNMKHAFDYARDHSGLDFCAIAHQHKGPHVFGATEWREYLDLNDSYNTPPEFITLVALENYMTGGHRIVYFRNPRQAREFKMRDDRPEENPLDTPEELYEALRSFDCMTVIHHPMYIWPGDFSKPLDPMERAGEICSRWGSSEAGSPHSLQHALAMGHRLGLIGGTDNQCGIPGGGPFGFNEGRGLAAALVEERTRDGVYDAIHHRRAYATTGEKMLLYFSMSGHIMGADLAEWSGERVFTIRAAGTNRIRSVELLRNNRVLHRIEPDHWTCELTLADTDPLDDVLLSSPLPGVTPFCVYQVRVTQIDRERAWSSPIWVRP